MGSCKEHTEDHAVGPTYWWMPPLNSKPTTRGDAGAIASRTGNPPAFRDGSSKAFKVQLDGRYSNPVEVMGRDLNHSDQGECLRKVLEMIPSGSQSAKTRTPRRVFRRLSPAHVEELIKGYVEGVPVDVLADRFGVDQSTVQKHARRHDLPRRSPRLGPNQSAEAARLYLEGQSLANLANHFGVATDTVAFALRRSEVTLRPRRGWEY